MPEIASPRLWQLFGFLMNAPSPLSKPRAHGMEADDVYNRAIALPRHDAQRGVLLREAIRVDPAHARAHLSLGADERRQGRISSAIALLQVAASLLPKKY